MTISTAQGSIIEAAINGAGPELTQRNLAQRVRQQEILAQLGVSALDGASLDQLLEDTARLTAEGLKSEFSNDISSASWPSYGLTTVRQPVQEMIAQSINLLLEQIEGKQVEPRTIRIPAELVVRTSAII